MWGEILGTIAATHISDIFSGILARMSASRLESMAYGVSSSLSLTRRNLMISSLVGLTDIVVTRLARRVLISAQIWGLPVTNIRLPGDFSMISLNESKSRNRCTAVHSSRASMTINMRCEDVMSCNIFTISASCGLRPLMASLCSRNACHISSRIPPVPLTICFSKDPSILVAVCSFRAAKSK